MIAYLIPRHFINSEATLHEYKEGIVRINAADELVRSKGLPIQIGLKLTVAEDKLGYDLCSCIRESLPTLPKGTWLLYDNVDRGAGISSQQVFFSPTFQRPPGIVINSCLDQYPIHTPEALERILDLAQRTDRENALYATGSRDVPVVLATNKRNSDLRIIHELFHSLAIGSDKLHVPDAPAGITPSYAAIGESTTGFDAVNTAHSAFPLYAVCMALANAAADMSGFATNYYMALKGAQLAPITRGYVCSFENKFYATRDEKTEYDTVMHLIKGQTTALGRTDVANMLSSAVRDKRSRSRLAEFYSLADVTLVQDAMSEALAEHRL